jgi:hypothetical protein
MGEGGITQNIDFENLRHLHPVYVASRKLKMKGILPTSTCFFWKDIEKLCAEIKTKISTDVE